MATFLLLNLSSINTHFDISTTYSFWKHCGKRRNCSKREISPFPTLFSTQFENCTPFVHIFDIIFIFAAALEEPRIGIWGKGLSVGNSSTMWCTCSYKYDCDASKNIARRLKLWSSDSCVTVSTLFWSYHGRMCLIHAFLEFRLLFSLPNDIIFYLSKFKALADNTWNGAKMVKVDF